MVDRIEFARLGIDRQSNAFAKRLEIRARQDEILQLITASVADAEISAKTESKVNSAAFWAASQNFLSAQKLRIAQASAMVNSSCVNIGHSLSQKFFDPSRWSEFVINLQNQLAQPVSVGSPAQLENDVDGLFEDSQADELDLIKLPGKQTDDYWQYYEDCERWGVEFSAMLFNAQNSGELKLAANSKSIAFSPVWILYHSGYSVSKSVVDAQPLSIGLKVQSAWSWLGSAEFVAVETFTVQQDHQSTAMEILTSVIERAFGQLVWR